MKKNAILNELGEKAIYIIDNIEKLTIEQLPDICRQVIQYEIFRSIIVLFACSFVIFLALPLLKRGMSIVKKSNETEYCRLAEEGFASILVFGIISLIPAAMLLFQTFVLIKVIVAPKIYLLEYFKQLI
jgi:hypothetical protein